jgi:hypothetical protein
VCSQECGVLNRILANGGYRVFANTLVAASEDQKSSGSGRVQRTVVTQECGRCILVKQRGGEARSRVPSFGSAMGFVTQW